VIERLRRIAAIVRADFLIRFRRLSTVVVFLLLSGLVYVWIPDPSTGWAALVIDDNRRALYDSTAIGLATAMLATLFVGLAGFFVISNAIGRDVASRCGVVIASTTTHSSDYLVGKLVGNIAFLATFTGGFMVSSMVMLVVRNEAALEPWFFVKQYLLLLPPAIVFVAVLAIVFESISFLSGRLGDVAYFVLWSACVGAVAGLLVNGLNPGPARYVDFAGMGFVFEQMRPTMQTANLSIGGPFDATKPLFVVRGLTLDHTWMLPRIGSLLAPLPLLAIALRSFHRFDPAHIRDTGVKGRGAWITSFNAAMKPLPRLLFAFDGSTSSRPSLIGAAAIDARMTIAANPAMLLVVLGLTIATVASTRTAFVHGVLPSAFGIIGLSVAGVSCRERRAGTLGLIHAAPLLKARFVWWKALATAIVAVVLLAAPIVRLAFASPAFLLSFGVGVLAMVAAATSLGVISSTPKTFVVVFLTYLYLVASDHGASAALDFAGFYEKATLRVTLTYAVAAVAFLALAQVVYGWRLRREN
jgi:hypothetical protein